MNRFSLTIVSLLAAVTAFGQSFKVIPPTEAYAGENFRIVYRLTNAEGDSKNIPQVNGCTLIYGPAVSTSYSTQIVNGHQSSQSTVDYSYTYQAPKAGTYTIPAASVNVGGKKLTTSPFQFTVHASRGNASAPTASSSRAQQPSMPQLPPASQSSISKDDMFVKVVTNKTSVYEQEAIECSIKLYTRYANIISFSQTAPPKYDGFLIEELDIEPTLNREETVNGKVYHTAILKKVILFPQKSGSLTVSTGTYDLLLQTYQTINTGFAIYTVPGDQFHTDLREYKQTINVTPLPDPKPSGFNGAVGAFTYSNSLSNDKLRTGEAASLTLNVSGTGNIKYLKLPSVEFPSDFEQYTPTQDYDTHIAGASVTGTMVAKYDFVPAETGKFTLNAPSFVYFDPEKRTYITLPGTEYSLDVAKGVSVKRSGDQNEVSLRNADILHIKLGDKQQSASHAHIAFSVMYWLVYLLLIVAFIAVIIVMRKRAQMYADAKGLKYAKANKVVKKRLEIAEKYLKADKRDEFYDAILKALWGYFSDKMGIPVSELNRENVKDELIKLGAGEDIFNNALWILDECEMARYTPQSQQSSLADVYKKTSTTIRELESIKKSQAK